MGVQLADTNYTLSITPAEREVLLAALEFMLGKLRGHDEANVLLADARPAVLDRLADSLFLMTPASN